MEVNRYVCDHKYRLICHLWIAVGSSYDLGMAYHNNFSAFRVLIQCSWELSLGMMPRSFVHYSAIPSKMCKQCVASQYVPSLAVLSAACLT